MGVNRRAQRVTISAWSTGKSLSKKRQEEGSPDRRNSVYKGIEAGRGGVISEIVIRKGLLGQSMFLDFLCRWSQTRGGF